MGRDEVTRSDVMKEDCLRCTAIADFHYLKNICYIAEVINDKVRREEIRMICKFVRRGDAVGADVLVFDVAREDGYKPFRNSRKDAKCVQNTVGDTVKF